jgi:hypothetical protein
MKRLLAILLAGLIAAAALPACSSENEPDQKPKKKRSTKKTSPKRRSAEAQPGSTGPFPGEPDQPTTAPALKLGKETTIIQKPLLPDGRPDYLTWLNNRYSRGVTPKNNAAVVFVRTFGPDLLDEELLPQQLELLKTSLPDKTPQTESYPEDPPVAASFQKAFQGPWSAHEHSRLATWLYRNGAAIHRLVAASKRTRYFFPLLARASETTVPFVDPQWPDLGDVRREAKKLKLRASRATFEGRFDDAWRDARALCNLGRLLQQGPTVLDQLRSLAVWSLGLDAATDLLATGKLSPGQLQRLYAELPPFDERAMGEALSNERVFALDITIAFAKNPQALSKAIQSPVMSAMLKSSKGMDEARSGTPTPEPPSRPDRQRRQPRQPRPQPEIEQLAPGPLPPPRPGVAPSRRPSRPGPKPRQPGDREPTIPPPVARPDTADPPEPAKPDAPPRTPSLDEKQAQRLASTAQRYHEQIDFNTVLRRINAFYERQAELGQLPPVERRKQTAEIRKTLDEALRETKLDPQRDAETLAAADENTSAVTRWAGSVLLAILGRDLTRAHGLAHHAAQKRDLLELAIALELHRQKTGTFPVKLDELVGVYIREVPADRFADAPPIYRRMGEGYVLYSPGPNGKDNGGTKSEEATFEGDIVLRVAGPAPVGQDQPTTAPATQPETETPATRPSAQLEAVDGWQAEVARLRGELAVAAELGAPSMRHDATRGKGPEHWTDVEFEGMEENLLALPIALANLRRYVADLSGGAA